MAKNKKRKKPQHHQGGGINHFAKELQKSVTQQGIKDFSLTPSEKKVAYKQSLIIAQPSALDNSVSNKELKQIFIKIKEAVKHVKVSEGDFQISTYNLILMSSYAYVVYKSAVKELGEDDQQTIKLSNQVKEFESKICEWYIGDIYQVISRLNHPNKKQYGIEFCSGINNAKICRIKLSCRINAYEPQTKYFKVNSQYRPAYRLSSLATKDGISWLQIPKENIEGNHLHNHYAVYIQGHAMQRLKERLNLVDHKDINYLLWSNVINKTNIIKYRNLYLSEVILYKIRIGYFVYEIIENNLVIKTFLFITHNSTPEGDKLQQITGLGKHDISYWKIDRLSTFINLDETQFPRLMKLFTEAGMGDLSKLKDKKFDIESIQTDGFEGLRKYLFEGNSYQKQLDSELYTVY